MALLQASDVTVIKIYNVYVQDVSLAKAEFISSLVVSSGVVGRQGLPPGSIEMEPIHNLQPESADPSGVTDDFESPSPMDLSVTESQAHSLPAASEEADLRVRGLEAVVDDLHRQSGIAEEVHRRAIRRVRHRGADPGGLDAHELDARERDAEGKAAQGRRPI